MSRMGLKDSWKRRGGLLYAALAPLVGLLFLPLVLNFDLLDQPENLTVNWRFQFRAPNDPPADPHLVLISIDQESLDQLGGWPWERSVHADLCKLAATMEPAVLGFDLLFTEPRDPAADKDFGEAAAKPKAVVTGAVLGAQKTDPPPLGKTVPFPHVEGDISRLQGEDLATVPIPELTATSSFGFVNCEPGSDGVRRMVPMVVRYGKQVFPSLSLQLLCQYWNVPPDKVTVQLGRDIRLETAEGIKTIPIDEEGKFLINYRNQDSFTAWPYVRFCSDIYKLQTENVPLRADHPQLKGSILLVGQVEAGLTDLGATPLNYKSPLVMVHMNAMNNILQGDYITVLPHWSPWFLFGLLALSWATLFYLRAKSPLSSVLIPLMIIFCYAYVATAIFATRSIQLPMVWPIAFFASIHFGAVVLRWLEELRSKQQIRGVFASYIAPSVLNQLLAHPENIQLGGVRKPVTMLFSDIRGFTSLSESMDEAELVTQLNEYFEKMVDCVNRYRGTLHKYIGDAVMAVWGDVIPEKPEIDAANAVRAALAMRAELVELNAGWTANNRKPFKIGIGLNFGPVLVGNIGATQRREFTVIGDHVNLAARLEGVTKEYHTDLIISESVHALVRGEFLVRTLGVIQVKGKTQFVKIYEVLADLKNDDKKWPRDWVETYERAMAAYFDRKFTEARDLFRKCLRERPDDYNSKVYAEQSEKFISKPPPKNWDGTHKMTTK